MRDDKRRQKVKIELLSQWKLEAESRNNTFKNYKWVKTPARVLSKKNWYIRTPYPRLLVQRYIFPA